MAAPDLSVFDRIKTKADYDREEELFQLEKRAKQRAVQSNDPAAVKLANEIGAARASGDVNRMNDLIMSAKMWDRGVIADQFGAPVEMYGYGDAVGGIAGRKKAYEANAQNYSDLQYDPLIAGGEAGARLNQQLQIEPQITAANKEAGLITENQINAQSQLPKIEDQGQQALDLINQIETSPGLSASVGMPNIFKGRVPFVGNIAGSPAADFDAKLQQLGGKQFLEAFESLKGGGQITQVEGEKATNAIGRMQTSQSEVEFKKALNELKGIVNQGVKRARSKAGQAADPRNIPMTAVQYLKENPKFAPQFDEKYGAGAAKMVLGK